MEKVSEQSLINIAPLTIPSVIVISTNLGCACCLERFHRILIKISGLKEYTIDVKNSIITIKGNMKLHESWKIKRVKTNSFRQMFSSWITKKFNQFRH